MRLLIAGGGTGGHLFPGIAVAEEFLARNQENEVLFVGTEQGIEARLLPRLGFSLRCITAAGIRYKGTLSQIKGVAMLLYGYSESRKILREFRPDVVLGVGGYASGPVVLAARGLLIRRFIHEQNAIPGLTNKVLSRFAERVFVSLDGSEKFFPKDTTLLTGNPVRKEIRAELAAGSVAEEAPTGKKPFRLLIFGGSAGAHSINLAVAAALPILAPVSESLLITHQTGEKDLAEVREAHERAGFKTTVVPFIDDMAAAYRDADLVICRAGATTVAEVAISGKPCIFIPFPHAVDDHQRLNAEALLKKQAGYMLLERELSGESLAGLIRELMADPEQLRRTGQNARSLARPDAAKVIVDEMLKNAG
ncbi:undecaprenyldiphospho-muramoylpentapeptide beta-N-acetylglucosaminyltransferase [Geobacter sp. DSM 9736]|uniref:undecaprenyldiphospho-muramoylpentapeptide beta-N-acetylglucosaminyltransferase n=1 Tax=Geobacter sp. DSM 9736 TaxID=1277350 RepID=UPI000B4FFA88|nr:undecaprenyldiphospho-muramoylpentapeptide beta-N-acetylglucosaminyltransferase [Geobacter sp. DSM 9736]SNB47817.1 UDP-N-acetylglucosamine-N-acetylmuramylpentapeptide N-acetylglucosamine transferase [Geobacter sp. DSM 9736]